jgi:hypothetical protein
MRLIRALGEYLLHLLLAVPVPILAGFLVAIPVVLLPNTVVTRAIDSLNSQPVFPLDVAIAAGLGWWRNRRNRSVAAIFVFLIPLTAMLANLASFRAEGNSWRYILDTFFTSHCGNSDCLYELEVTAPFYCSIAYSIAAALAYKMGEGKQQPAPAALTGLTG